MLSPLYQYKYDDKGNQIESNDYNADGSLEGSFTVKYNNKGKMIEFKGFDAEGNPEFKMTFEFDDKGNEIANEKLRC